MSEVADLRRDVRSLRTQNEELQRRVADAEQAIAAFSHGEVDAPTLEGAANPVLLRAAQDTLRESQRLLRAVFDGALEPMVLTDDQGRYVDANPAACALYGLTLEQLLGRSIGELLGAGMVDDAGYRTFREQGFKRGSFAFRRADGIRHFEYSSVSNVAPGLDLCVMRDTTERTVAEEALRESRDQLEAAQAIAHIGSWTSGFWPDGKIEWSRECYRIFDIPDGTPMTVASFFEHIHPDDRDRMRRATRAAIEDGAPADIEHRLQRPDGRVRHVHQRGVVERDAAGRPVRMVGTVQDITDRHAAVEALQASEERYRRIVESTSEGVWMYDREGITTFMSARMASMLGYTVEEAVGQSIFHFIDEGDREEARTRMARRQQGASESGDFRLRRKDGSELWTSVQANSLFDAEGGFEAGLVLVTDISAKRHADEARAQLAAIVESCDDAMFSRDLEGRILSWNAGAERLYGYTANEMMGSATMNPVPPDRRDEIVAILRRVESGGGVGRLETVRTRKDGTNVEVAITVSALKSGDGRVVGTSVITHDLTERRRVEAALRRTEEQFRQAQKMEAVGRLAGGVAHDFNNLMSVVLSYSELILTEVKAGDPLCSDIGEIQKAGRRASELTRQLLAFSRQQVLQPRIVDLNQVIAGMRSMLRRLLGEDIELTALTSPHIGRVVADPGQIEQVVMNLAVNARDAMPQGGKLTIEASNVELDAGYADAHFGVTPGDYVMLAVSDTGVGMDAETRARIFEPFFTTKEAGKGTGLGLSTVFGVVKQSGGHVGVYSEPGQGCTFKVYLRRTDQDADAPISAGPPIVLRGSETILLVEDEDQVRAVACAILRRNGYRVLDAANGGEASLIARDFASKIHVLVTDVVMPRMSGRKLAEELAPQRPDMKVLFTSGYTDDAIVHHGVLDAGVAFLQKPFTPDGLLRRVREVLDADRRGSEEKRAAKPA